MSITRLVASYRLTTPMFCSGADQEKAELRPASLKGALRFWYRALALAQYKTFEEVRKAEDALFGSTRTGQANMLLSLREENAGSSFLRAPKLLLERDILRVKDWPNTIAKRKRLLRKDRLFRQVFDSI